MESGDPGAFYRVQRGVGIQGEHRRRFFGRMVLSGDGWRNTSKHGIEKLYRNSQRKSFQTNSFGIIYLDDSAVRKIVAQRAEGTHFAEVSLRTNDTSQFLS